MNFRIVRHALVLAIPFLFAGCFKTREDIAREKEDQEVRSNLQQNIVEYNQGLDKLQSEVGRLHGRIDELEHQRKKELAGMSSARESDQKARDKTIDELRAKVASLQDAQNALFEEVKKLHEDGLAERAKPAPAPTPAKKKGLGSFDAAVAAFKTKDYPGATAGFRSYLESSPKGKHALDAHYFLGESLFRQKEFEQASVEFGAVQEKSPSTALGRKSTLRLALCFKAMGKNKEAKAFAQLLVQGSPDSEEAKAARKLLK